MSFRFAVKFECNAKAIANYNILFAFQISNENTAGCIQFKFNEVDARALLARSKMKTDFNILLPQILLK